MKNPTLKFKPAEAPHIPKLVPLIYDSAHELLDFIFGSRAAAEAALGSLLRKESGHFSYSFCRALLVDGEVAGVTLGYSKAELKSQELTGTLHMLRAMPLARTWHLVAHVSRALSSYVPPPSNDAYYINNIAVDPARRSQGLGKVMLENIARQARDAGYRCIELDVTASNEAGIRFYEQNGFRCVSTSGSRRLTERYGLPRLKRMRNILSETAVFPTDNTGRSTSTNVVNDITQLNPVAVDSVIAPGTIRQLQEALRQSDKPISIGGGRFSMGGQIAVPGTLHIDMRGLNRILSVDPDRKTVRVQGGARWREIQRVISDYGLAVSIMQTYADFTVGGSISVNCHGRYIGLGPLVMSVRSVRVALHDGNLVDASREENKEIFFGVVGGYGALGIIVEAELDLADNDRIQRSRRKMKIDGYQSFFSNSVRNDERAVFHNADLVPPEFRTVNAVTWRVTDKPINRTQPEKRCRLYLAQKTMLWSITSSPIGHFLREYIYEPLSYLRPKVVERNDEASYDVGELEPLSREGSTYVLQEYFVPIEQLQEFTEPMAEILTRHKVKTVNVSVRHAYPDSGTYLSWAPQEVFALVLYYRQGTTQHEREAVAVWTRELIDAVLDCDGTYYLPYQPHATHEQFHRAYPRARELFRLKDRLDPEYRFRNSLWEKYYRGNEGRCVSDESPQRDSEFRQVYGDTCSRDDFFRFLQVVYNLYPEDQFHQLIIDACAHSDKDSAIYRDIKSALPGIRTPLSDITYALPALRTQKKEMVRQVSSMIPRHERLDGYLEIGSTGRYVKGLKKALNLDGSVYLTNDTVPDNSPPEVMERGGLGEVGEFFRLDEYEPISSAQIPDQSVDLVTCFIGLHHCPREKLSSYLESVHRVLRPGGRFILRDHDACTDEMRMFCSLVHSVFNAGLGVSWEENSAEVRLFEGIEFWIDTIEAVGFQDTGKRLLQANDPSLNTLTCFTRE